MNKNLIKVGICFHCFLLSCQPKQRTEIISTIDSTLQVNATSILEEKLSEINAQSGQVIVWKFNQGKLRL